MRTAEIVYSVFELLPVGRVAALLRACMRKLRVYRSPRLGFTWKGLDTLTDHIPLLPYLSDLIIQHSLDPSYPELLAELLPLLRGSPLKVICASGDARDTTAWLTEASYNHVSATRQFANTLTRLDLFVKGSPPSQGGLSSFADTLRTLTSLRSLGLGPGILSTEVLLAAGQLLELQVLEIRFHPSTQKDWAGVTVPHGTFARLSRLVVYETSPEDLLHLVKLQSLVDSLDSIYLEITADDDHFVSALAVLRGGAVRLKGLELQFPFIYEEGYDQQPYRFDSASTLEVISQIPLTHLTIRNADVYILTLLDFDLECPTLWHASLTSLRLPDQLFMFEDLELFATLRQLQVLAVTLQDGEPPCGPFRTVPLSRQTLRLESAFYLYGQSKAEVVDQLAL
ncbi:hypothetical protein FRC09_005639 [Ceratobasidium sp. 395]|nr:hypothetical protein FRC09_005639 [Ceratobasidium sp. 395]